MVRRVVGFLAILITFGCSGPTGTAEELVLDLSCASREFLAGEPVVVTVSIRNQGAEPVEERWTDLNRVLQLSLHLNGREIPVYAMSPVTIGELEALGGAGKITIPPGHTLRFSFPLNFPDQPFNGIGSALGNAWSEAGELRGELHPGGYQLRARLLLAARRLEVMEALWPEFAKEHKIPTLAKATDEQMMTFSRRLDEHLARLKQSGRGGQYLASAQFGVERNGPKNAELQNLLRGGVIALAASAKKEVPDYAGATAKFKELAEKGKGTAWEPWALYGLGRTHLLKKDAREALGCFERAGEIAADNPHLSGSALVQRKACYELLGETEKAKEVDKVLRERLGFAGVFAQGVMSLRPSPKGPK